jgi:hypothetical protein
MILSAQQGNDTARIKKLNEERANFVAASEGTLPSSLEPPDPLPAVEALAQNNDINALQQKRITAALKITQVKPGATIPNVTLNELEDALIAEDATRLKVYNAATDKMLLGQKVALARARIEWLSLKYRVARKAFGASLVPDWEDQESTIRSQLAKAYEEFYSLRAEQAVTLPKTKDSELAESFLLRRHILAGRLGLYPNFPEDDFVDKLNDSTEKMIANQPNATLRLKVEGDGDRFFYRLVDDNTWNGGAPSSPRPRVEDTPTPQPSKEGLTTLVPTRAVTNTTPITNPTTSGTPRPVQPTTASTNPQLTVQPTLTSAPATNPQPTPTMTPTNVPVVPPTNTPVPPSGPPPTGTPTSIAPPRNTPLPAQATPTPKPYP